MHGDRQPLADCCDTMNTERDWQDATADELRLLHMLCGEKPTWMDADNWRKNMRACATLIRKHVELTAHIPVIEAMRAALRDRCFYTGGRKEFERQGYSLLIDEETAIRDINYRNARLYATADEAVDAVVSMYSADDKVSDPAH